MKHYFREIIVSWAGDAWISNSKCAIALTHEVVHPVFRQRFVKEIKHEAALKCPSCFVNILQAIQPIHAFNSKICFHISRVMVQYILLWVHYLV